MTSKRTSVLLASILLLVVLLPTAQALTLTKLTNPATLPTGNSNGMATYSPDDSMLAIAHSTSPYITIYQVSGGTTYTKLANPAVLPTGDAFGADFSPDGQFLAVAHTTSPFLTIYSISGTTFTKLANPAVLPGGTGFSVAFSPDSSTLAVGHNTGALSLYSISGTTFTKLADPAVLPGTAALGLEFSPGGNYLAAAGSAAPRLVVYSISGTTYTKLADPATLVPAEAHGVSWRPDSLEIAIAHDASPFVSIYSLASNVLTKEANVLTLPASNGQGVKYSPDGGYLAVGHTSTPFVSVYETSDYSKFANPASLPTGVTYGVDWTSDSAYLALSHSITPFVTIYQTDVVFTPGVTPEAPTGLRVTVTRVPGEDGALFELRWPVSANDPDQEVGEFTYTIQSSIGAIGADVITGSDSDGQRFNQVEILFDLGTTTPPVVYDPATRVFWIVASNGPLDSPDSCTVTISDATLNTKTCGAGTVGGSSIGSIPNANSDVGEGLVGFCAALMGDSTASLFFCGLIFVVVVFLGVAAAFAALAGGKGMPAAIAGSIAGFGLMVFNIFVGLWEIWAAVILIILAAGIIAGVVKMTVFGSSASGGPLG